MAECDDYRPGTVAGKNRPVCKHFILESEGKGVCRHPQHFMCEYAIKVFHERKIGDDCRRN